MDGPLWDPHLDSILDINFGFNNPLCSNLGMVQLHGVTIRNSELVLMETFVSPQLWTTTSTPLAVALAPLGETRGDRKPKNANLGIHPVENGPPIGWPTPPWKGTGRTDGPVVPPGPHPDVDT